MNEQQIKIVILMIMVSFIILLVVIKNKDEDKENNKKEWVPPIYRADPNNSRSVIAEPKKGNQITYQRKKLMTKSEISYARAIYKATPTTYKIYPQICLASIIHKQADSKFATELFRIVDYCRFWDI